MADSRFTCPRCQTTGFISDEQVAGVASIVCLDPLCGWHGFIDDDSGGAAMQPPATMETGGNAPEATIDQKVAIFEEAGNGPEATAEYRATLEATATEEAAEAAVAQGTAAPFAKAATVLRSESGTEQKFATIAAIFELIAKDW